MSMHAHMKSLTDDVIPKGLLPTPFHNNEPLLRTYCVSGEHGIEQGTRQTCLHAAYFIQQAMIR